VWYIIGMENTKMKFKIFGLVWDLKPILMFLWGSIVLILCSGFLASAFTNDLVNALLFFFGSMVWVYITNTVEDNKKLEDEKSNE